MSYYDGYNEPPEEDCEIDPNFEFNKSLNELIEKEVEKRMIEKNADYEEVLKRRDGLLSKNSEQAKEIYLLKSSLRQAESQYYKQGKEAAYLEMFNGWKLNDQVWFLKNEHEWKECPTCKGKKKVIAKVNEEEIKIKCPTCRGIGNESTYKISVHSGKVGQLDATKWTGNTTGTTELYIKPDNRKYDSFSSKHREVFKTKEEAEKCLKEKEEKEK